MARHIVCSLADVPPGHRKAVKVRGRQIVVFNIKGELFALLNSCPHQGARLDQGHLGQLVEASAPGEVVCSHAGEIIRCPWHGWEFHVRTGKSQCEPTKTSVKSYPAYASRGCDVESGELKAETFPVEIEQDYIVIEM